MKSQSGAVEGSCNGVVGRFSSIVESGIRECGQYTGVPITGNGGVNNILKSRWSG